MNAKYIPHYKQQLGQAMTELNIVAAFVLLPLFLLIPIIGKYTDIKQTTVQAARYMAWERTAHFRSTNDDVMANDLTYSSFLPIKSEASLQSETIDRFFRSAGTVTAIQPTVSAVNDSNLNNFWRSHNPNNKALVDAVSLNDPDSFSDKSRKETQPWLEFANDVAELVDDAVDLIKSPLISLANRVNGSSFVGGAQIFNVAAMNNINGIPFIPDKQLTKNNYNKVFVNYKMNTIESRNQGFGSYAEESLLDPFNKLQTKMSAKSALLTDSWSAQNNAVFKKRVEERVLAHMVAPFLEPLQNAVSYRIQPPKLPKIGKIYSARTCFRIGLGVVGPKVCNGFTRGTEVDIQLRPFAVAPELASGKFNPGQVDVSVVPGNIDEPDCRLGQCTYKDAATRKSNVTSNTALSVLRAIVPSP